MNTPSLQRKHRSYKCMIMKANTEVTYFSSSFVLRKEVKKDLMIRVF